jgi:hypothetical protein
MAPNTQHSLNNLQSLSSETSMLSVRDKNDTDTTSASTMIHMPRNLSRSTLAELAKREQADNSVSVTKYNQLRVRYRLMLG